MNINWLGRLFQVFTVCILCGNSFAASLAYSFNSTAGWNLFGNSVTSPLTVNQIFKNPALYSTVWKWDASNSKWVFYAPSLEANGTLSSYAASKGYSVLTVVNPGEGFWVNAITASSVPQPTDTAFLLSSSALQPNWNLVATGNNIGAADFNRSLSGVLTGNPANVISLWAWDSARQRWYFYSPVLDSVSGSLANYIQGKGYEDFATNHAVLGNGVGFWVNYPVNAAGSVIDNELKFFNAMNAMRTSLGIAPLTRNTSLDQASKAHAYYLDLNVSWLSSIMGQVDPLSGIIYEHSEDPGKPGYLAATPKDRDITSGYAGINDNEILTFDGNAAVADGNDTFNGLMNSVYHRQGILRDDLCDIGIGTTSVAGFVADMGCKTSLTSIASGSLVVFPADGQVNPYPYWETGMEVPNPLANLADKTQIAGPISVTVRAGDTLTTNNFTLSQNGKPINAQLLTSQTDKKISANNAFLVPLAPLQLGGASYSASFNGTVNGNPVSKTWSFTTPSNIINVSPVGPLTMKNGQSLAIDFHVPSGLMNYEIVTPIQLSDIQIVQYSSSKIMLTVASSTISGDTPLSLTLQDLKFASMPPQTIQITVIP